MRRGRSVRVVVAGFAPEERPALWAPGCTDGAERTPETLVLNADNDAVVRMMTRS